MTERTLVLLRHAKSDWPAGVPDVERPLADRGRSDAPVAGDLLARLVGSFDHAIVSPATRTQQTWMLVGDRVSSHHVMIESAIYDASVHVLLTVVRALPDSASSALLIGHNPGIADLTLLLAGDGDADARERIVQKFPTCGVAVLRVTGAWTDLAPGSATLTSFHIPRAGSA